MKISATRASREPPRADKTRDSLSYAMPIAALPCRPNRHVWRDTFLAEFNGGRVERHAMRRNIVDVLELRVHR
jgi:hypothetical protein